MVTLLSQYVFQSMLQYFQWNTECDVHLSHLKCYSQCVVFADNYLNLDLFYFFWQCIKLSCPQPSSRNQTFSMHAFSSSWDCSGLNSVWLQQPKGLLTEHQRTVKVTKDTLLCILWRLLLDTGAVCVFLPQRATKAPSQNGDSCRQPTCASVTVCRTKEMKRRDVK